MKKLQIFLLIALVGGLFSFSFKPKDADITWYEWNDGYPLALKKNKLVLVDVYTNWCGWCKKMDRDTYSDKEIKNQINKNFIAIRLNPEKTDVVYKVDTLSLSGYQLLNVLTNGQRTGYPTTIVINPKNNQIIHAEAGYQDAVRFKQTLQDVLAKK